MTTKPKVYQQIPLNVPPDWLAKLNQHVRQRHITRRAYIIRAVDEAIKRDLEAPTVREAHDAAPEQT